MDANVYPMSNAYPALSSAVDAENVTSFRQTGSDVTSSSQNSHSSFSDNETISEPDSPEPNVKVCGESDKANSGQHKNPGLSYIALISMAIQSAVDKRMLLSEIYQWISERYPYYNMKEKSWRNSIRHNLSLNECFVKNGRSENGKGNYWSIHPANIADFSRGDYRRRRARRRVRKCDEDLRRLCTRSPYPSPSPPSPEPHSTTAEPADGYVPMMSTPIPTNYLTSIGLENKHRDEWNFHNFPQYPVNGYKSPDINFYPGESCSQLYNYQQPDAYCGLYAPGANKHSVARPSSATGEFNVNVNVNVYGNNATSRQYPSPTPHTSPVSPTYYIPPCGQTSKSAPNGYSYPYSDSANDYPYNGSGQGFSGCAFDAHGHSASGENVDKPPGSKE